MWRYGLNSKEAPTQHVPIYRVHKNFCEKNSEYTEPLLTEGVMVNTCNTTKSLPDLTLRWQ